MRNRPVAWGSACAVVLAAVSAGLINELHAGWTWWIAAAIAVLAGAGLAWWLAPTGSATAGDRLDAGAVKAGRDIVAPVRTRIRGNPPPVPADGGADALGPGAVKADRDIRGEVSTDIDHTDRPST